MKARPAHFGVSLIEMMVGLAAGLILLAALSYFLLGTRQLGRTHDDISRMQESGRIAFDILGRAIRQAGARTDVDVPFAADALTVTEGGGSPDSITVRYDAQDGGEADCLGQPVATGEQITYVFAVIDNALTCTNDPAQPYTTPPRVVVVDNIENMQITYDLDTNKDGVIEFSKQLASRPGLTPGQIAAVRVSLVVRGPTPNAAANNAGSSSDGFLRQVYTSTFTVRNQAR